MMAIFGFYWPVLVVALLIGIVTGVLAYRSPRSNRRS